MKKFTLAAGIVLLSLGTQAQQFYVRGGFGYAIPQAGQSIDPTGTPYNGNLTNNSTGTLTYNYKNGASFASGFYGSFGGGYMFNDHIGFELDLMTNLAPKKYNNYANNQVIDSIPYNIATQAYTNITALLAPQIVLQTGGDTWNFYARGGVVLPLYTQLVQQQTYVNLPGNGAIETDVFTYDLKTNFSLGLTGAIGAQYNISDNLCFWGELNMLSMSLYLKEADLKSITSDGAPVPISATQVTAYPYSNNFTTGGNTYGAYSIPFSNVGMHFGIMYKFDKLNHSEHTARPSSHNGRGKGRDNVF